jgi:hypothetical protein
MAVVCGLAVPALAGVGQGSVHDLLVVAATVPLGGITFLAAGRAFGIRELEALVARLRTVGR